MRRLVIPTIVVVYAVGALVALGNAWSNATPEPSVLASTGLNTATMYALSRDLSSTGPRVTVLAPLPEKSARLLDTADPPKPSVKSERRTKKKVPTDGNLTSDQKMKLRFEAKRALASREKIAAAFQTAGLAPTQTVKAVALADPAPSRFASKPPVTGALTGPLLAFADPEPSRATDAFSAMDGGLSDDLSQDFVLPEDDGTISDESAVNPEDYDTTPDDAPLPLIRPRAEPRQQAAPEVPMEQEKAEKPKPEKPEIANKPEIATKPLIATKPDKPEKPGKPTGSLFAFAKPNDPAEDRSGGTKPFKNFFNRPKAGNGVAVYDISAAKVYMPDGSVLEAHSGIGKMADNPRYTHVKMNGPTPPHTYNLRMREKRFHGVEAIRMTPVNGKGMHGRTGILAHSYLLRGGRAESHGCVAFKDYPKFLKAFKQGKIKQLVVIPGGGKSKDPTIRVAKNGREA